MNLRYIQKFLDLFGLVLVCNFVSDFDDYPDNFPYKIWIERKSNYYIRTEK
jgi:hypothetical protein